MALLTCSWCILPSRIWPVLMWLRKECFGRGEEWEEEPMVV